MKLRYAVPLSVVAIWIAGEWDADLLGFMAIGWLGVLMAVRLRPSLRVLLSERRAPGRGECAALLIGLAGAIVTLLGLAASGAAVWFLARGRTADLDGNTVLTAAWALVTVAVLWRDLRVAAEARPGDPPLWPSASALVAAAPLGVGLLVLSEAMVGPVIEDPGSVRPVIEAAYLAPIATLLLALGGGLLVQAWAFGRDVAAVFRWVMTAQIGAWCALLLGLCLNLSGLLGSSIETLSGGVVSAAFAVPVALAWIAALWRIRSQVVSSTLSAVVIVGLVVILTGLSLAIPAALLETQWPEFAALLLLLPGLAIVAGLALLLPVVVRWLAWDPARPPWAWVAGLFQRV